MAPVGASESPAGQHDGCSTSLELVFHRLGDRVQEVSAAFADATRRVLDADKAGEVRIVCPYLSSHVVSGIIQDRMFRLVTDMNACFEGEQTSLSLLFLKAT